MGVLLLRLLYTLVLSTVEQQEWLVYRWWIFGTNSHRNTNTVSHSTVPASKKKKKKERKSVTFSTVLPSSLWLHTFLCQIKLFWQNDMFLSFCRRALRERKLRSKQHPVNTNNTFGVKDNYLKTSQNNILIKKKGNKYNFIIVSSSFCLQCLVLFYCL